MKIAITTTGKSKLTDRVSDTFSRAPTFTIITLEDLEIKESEVINNPASSLKQGAGPIAATTIKNQDIDLLITGELGPGAKTILEAFNIKTYQANRGKKVSQVIDEWKKLGL